MLGTSNTALYMLADFLRILLNPFFSTPERWSNSHRHYDTKSLLIKYLVPPYYRSLTWGAVGLRMLKDSSAFRHYVAAITVLLGALTTLLPAYLPKRMKSDAYVK